MKTYFIFPLLLLACVNLSAQTVVGDTAVTTYAPSGTSDVFYLYGNAIGNSNSITGKLTSAFIKGGYINDDIKGTTLDRLKNKNRLGVEANYGLTYVHFFRKRSNALTGYYLRYNQSLFLTSNYNAEAYKLFFYGNSQYAGQTVNVSPFRLYSLGQRSVGGGLMWDKNGNTFWLGADFVQGLQNTDIHATNASLTTDIDGQMLQLVGKVDVKQSARPTYNAGFGAALNAQWFTSIKDKVFINVMVDNLGIVAWNNRAQNYTRDTTFQFSGLDLNQVLQSDSAWQAVQDSLSTALSPSQKSRSYTTVLPFLAKLSATKYVGQGKLKLSVILSYRYIPAYIPLTAVQATYFVKWFSPSLTLMYGGYGGFNTGIGMGFNFGKGYSLIVESLLNEGWLAAKNASGMGFGVKFYKSFRR